MRGRLTRAGAPSASFDQGAAVSDTSPTRPPVEQEVADVGRVELLLVVQAPGPVPSTMPPWRPTISLTTPSSRASCVLASPRSRRSEMHIASVSQPRRRRNGEQRRPGRTRLDLLHRGRRRLLRRQREGGLVGVRDAGEDGVGLASRRSRAWPATAGVPGREHVGDDLALLGQPVHLDRHLGDDAEASLGADDHLAHRRAGRRRRQVAQRERCRSGAPRVSPVTMSAMSPYLSDCMPDDRVATQPPSVEWVNESGKWPSVQAARVQLRLQVGAEHAGLDARQPRRPRRPRGRGSSGPCRAVTTTRVSPSSALQRARDRRAAAERDDHRVALGGERASTAAPRPRCPGRRRRRCTRWKSPLRVRIRSRTLRPAQWTTRASSSVSTFSAPTTDASAASHLGARKAWPGTSSSARSGGRTTGAVSRSRPMWVRTNGAKPGLLA